MDAKRFHYTSEGGFEAELHVDDHLLVLDYPGIAVRFS
ncbi:putative glycolipid-binding domain-containing protein [Nocardioides sp. zg-1228]